MEELELDDIQGLVRHGYPYFQVAEYVLLNFNDVAGTKAWLAKLRSEPWIDGAHKNYQALGKEDCGVAIAFTRSGLAKLGLDDQTMRSFVIEYQEGMAAGHRARLLGDEGKSHPTQWSWGREDQLDGLHGLLIVFARPGEVASRVAEIEALAGGAVAFTRRFDGVSRSAEPFGFADGISQPYVEGLTRKDPPPGVRTVRAGEFVLGYLNEFGGYPASPAVEMTARAEGLLRERPDGRADLGRNGSFLVMRQLEQDVDAFKAFVDGDEHLAARMVGRWKNGSALVRYPSPDRRPLIVRDLERENDFSYHREDRHGLRCPIGAHIRRANPRDALADAAGIGPQEAQARVDRHRILRRGRVYQDGDKQGLLFLCLNANIERQFEFVQSVWLMNPEFGGLRGETDPLLGTVDDGKTRPMTWQEHRMARRVDGLGRFVTVRGGAYFFVPGLKAIDYLALA